MNFRRWFDFRPGSPGDPAGSAGAVPPQCPNCRSPRLRKKKFSFTAIYQIDDERSVSRAYTPIQVHCRKCRFLVNDDLHGDAQVVYAQLAAQAGGRKPQVRVRARVAKAMQLAGRLPALSDAERRQDYDGVREVWGCAGMHPIPEGELQDALTRIVHGYLAEGVHRIEVETLEQGIMMLSFYTATGWRPVRLARTADGGFVVYGQIQLYRVLDAL
jgi:hypothetical protein